MYRVIRGLAVTYRVQQVLFSSCALCMGDVGFRGYVFFVFFLGVWVSRVQSDHGFRGFRVWGICLSKL